MCLECARHLLKGANMATWIITVDVVLERCLKRLDAGPYGFEKRVGRCWTFENLNLGSVIFFFIIIFLCAFHLLTRKCVFCKWYFLFVTTTTTMKKRRKNHFKSWNSGYPKTNPRFNFVAHLNNTHKKKDICIFSLRKWKLNGPPKCTSFLLFFFLYLRCHSFFPFRMTNGTVRYVFWLVGWCTSIMSVALERLTRQMYD